MKNRTFTHRVLSALRWKFLSQVTNQLVAVTINLILIRILSPKDFGLMGMVNVFLGFALIVSDSGICSSIIQRKALDDKFLNTASTINLLLGFFITFLFITFKSTISQFFHQEQLEPIIMLLSVNFLFVGGYATFLALLRKNLQFKSIFIASFFSNLVSGIAAIVMAHMGLEVWSLVWKSVLFYMINFIIIVLFYSKKIALEVDKQSIFAIARFSIPLFSARSLSYWVKSVDNILIAKVLGDIQLGYYSKAKTLMMLPSRDISSIISSVLFPTLSTIQDNKLKVKEIYLASAELLAFFLYPVMLFIFTFHDSIVHLVLGPQWMPITEVVKYFSIIGLIRTVAYLNGSIFLALNKTKEQFWLGIMPQFFIVVAVVVGLPHGISEVAKNYLIVVFLTSVFIHYFVRKFINLSLVEFFNKIWVSLFTSIALFILSKWAFLFLSVEINALILVCSLVIWGGFYIMCQVLFNRRQLNKIWELLVRVFLEKFKRK